MRNLINGKGAFSYTHTVELRISLIIDTFYLALHCLLKIVYEPNTTFPGYSPLHMSDV